MSATLDTLAKMCSDANSNATGHTPDSRRAAAATLRERWLAIRSSIPASKRCNAVQESFDDMPISVPVAYLRLLGTHLERLHIWMEGYEAFQEKA